MRSSNASQPTLSFAIHLHGRLVVLAPFPCLFRSPSSARLCTCLFMLRPKQSRAYFISRQQNCLILAYSCRTRCSCSRSRAHCSRLRTTETGSCCSRCCHAGNRAPISAAAFSFYVKELNLTTGGYSDSRVPFDRWPGFRFLRQWHRCLQKTPATCAGVYQFFRGGRGCAARFRRRFAPLFSF